MWLYLKVCQYHHVFDHFVDSITVFVGVVQCHQWNSAEWSVVTVPVFSRHKGLLRVVSTSGVGCKWTDYFINVLAYADALVLILGRSTCMHGLVVLI